MADGRSVRVTVSTVKTDHRRKLPHYVRWRVDGQQHWRSFASKSGPSGANAFHASLAGAVASGSDWNRETGLPLSHHRVEDAPVLVLAQQFIQAEWTRLSPNTRRSYAEAMVAFVFAATVPKAPPPPEGARAVVLAWLSPSGTTSKGRPTWSSFDQLERPIRDWFATNGVPAGELDGPTLARVDKVMRRRPDTGLPYAKTTQSRMVNPVRRMLREAAALGLIERPEWPETKRGAKAKSEMGTRASEKEVFPTVEGLRSILRAMANHQPASRMYQTLSAVCAYGGLRPGEAVALSVEDLLFLHSPDASIRVERAWHGVGGGRWNTDSEAIAAPKTERSYRTIPVPRPLRDYLEEWVASQGLTTGRLFVTRTGGRPTQGNWNRALASACEKAGWSPALTAYDLRRLHASQLVLFTPITEAAERLGHSVEVLTKKYLRRVATPDTELPGWEGYAAEVHNDFHTNLFEDWPAEAVATRTEVPEAPGQSPASRRSRSPHASRGR